MKKLLLCFVAFCWLGLATAQSRTLEAAKALYTKGDFKGAVDIADDLQTSAAQAFAAQANSIYASTLPENKQEALYTQSEKYARKAIDLDPKNSDAYFEVARALGRLSLLRGVLAALSQGLGSQIRENLDISLQLEPKNSQSLIAYGLWHAEIVAKGVGWLYGASPEAAINYFERGMKLEPKTITHKLEYAHGLVVMDKNKYLAKAIALLEEAVTLTPNDAAERLDLAQAKRDLAALR